MIRQIVVEMGKGKPDRVGVLLASGDLTDDCMAHLGERLVRFPTVDRLRNLWGCIDGVRWQWVPMDGETPGLEYQTIKVPRTGPSYQDILEIERLMHGDPRPDCPGIRATGDPADVHQLSDWSSLVEPAPRPCDRVPRWLWSVVAVVGLGLIIAGVR